MRTPLSLRLLLALGLGLGVTGPAVAQAPPAPTPPVAPGPAPQTRVVPAPGGEVTVLADRIEELPDDVVVATGDVEITRANTRLLADRVRLNRTTGDAVAEGRVIFYDGETEVTGDRLEYNLRTGTGVIYGPAARTAPYYRLSGERMERLGESLYRIYRGTFTTCADDPPTWSFRFGRATADLEDFVYGTSVSFWVKNFPLIPFFPFFAAPIRRERETGFLFPRFGHSSSRGVYLETPFFWAINDSMDLTVAPIVYTERGLGASAEYRYALAERHGGRLAGWYLHEFLHEGDGRAVGSVEHEWRTDPRLSLIVDVHGVSDDDVLRDYGDLLEQRSAQRVESNVFLTRRWDAWAFVANLFAYQDLTTRKATELHRLPELSLIGVRQPVPGVPGLLWELETSFVNFVRDVGSDGRRLDVHPRLSRPFTPGGVVTITPFVGGRLTAYDRTVTGFRLVDDVGTVEVTEDEIRVRRLLEVGADVEMMLSRVYRVGGVWGIDSVLHTIEPRVNYTWIAAEGETRLPIWTQGIDSIPDTSRIFYSLTNRVRAKTVSGPGSAPVRWEALRVAVGHFYDLDRREPGDVLGTVIVHPTSRLQLRSDAAYSVQDGALSSFTTDLAVVFPRVQASVGQRYADPDVRFFTAAATADVARWLALRATTYYDDRSGTFVESRVAADIKFQCWALTVEYVQRTRRDDEIRFAVNLLGLGAPLQTSVGLGAMGRGGER
ncbi:MAG TPA: LPS assembly protein LptD [Candidatus Tectomicrobia bacterium]|nr:LPS assembly protein LptD [Candidatus Tectomicrobia bacterium]